MSRCDSRLLPSSTSSLLSLSLRAEIFREWDDHKNPSTLGVNVSSHNNRLSHLSWVVWVRRSEFRTGNEKRTISKLSRWFKKEYHHRRLLPARSGLLSLLCAIAQRLLHRQLRVRRSIQRHLEANADCSSHNTADCWDQ